MNVDWKYHTFILNTLPNCSEELCPGGVVMDRSWLPSFLVGSGVDSVSESGCSAIE